MTLSLTTVAYRMSSDAKDWLSNTVQALRIRLLKDLNDGLESTYRLSIPASRAELDQERTHKRRRLEEWLDEQARASNKGQKETVAQARLRHREGAIKLVAATWLNRLIVMGQMEAMSLVRVPVFTGGWNSKGFREFRQFAPALSAEEDESYPFLLNLTFEELAVDLPGLFGPVGLTALIPMPTATLRHLVETLQADSLNTDDRLGLWRDDTLLGWVYQFWNDPERHTLDEKIRNKGKIENHEIAAKTQLFTDRYMVEWLLQNSLGQMWLEMCAREGWTAEVVSTGTLDRLEARRAEWRGRRERGEIDEEVLMPLESDLEGRWKYYVTRPIQPGEGAPPRLKDLKILDPACGSGHFLVIAFDLLAALYLEEARHRGEASSLSNIATNIMENNLHGLDIDPRAVQIAAAALWLKFRTFAPKSEFCRLNLVASNLGLTALVKDDPAVVELVSLVEEETGVSKDLTLRVVETLKGADHLGSLLKVGEAVDRALMAQAPLLVGRTLTLEEARAALLARLEGFVARHSRSEDLGLRLRGEQLASGVRFIRLIREGQYHLVVGNPPYQGSGQMMDAAYIDKHFHEGRANVSVAFIQRSLELLIPGGTNALLTIRGWLFARQFDDARKQILGGHFLEALGDFDWGAFVDVVGKVLCVTAALIRKNRHPIGSAVAIQPFPLDTPYRNDKRRAYRKEAATLLQIGKTVFHPQDMQVIPRQPLVYWWDKEFLHKYAQVAKLGDESPGKAVQSLGNNPWLVRQWWEVQPSDTKFSKSEGDSLREYRWLPFCNGATGLSWYEPARQVVFWKHRALWVKLQKSHKTGGSSFRLANEEYYTRMGVAFAMIGSSFTARAHRYRSVFGNKGSSVFPDDIPGTLCLMNSSIAKYVLESLNPGIGFEVGDVNRLALFPIESAEQIVATLDRAFTQHEQARETSVEFRRPGPSSWKYAQDWAQKAVDRPAGAPLPEYIPREERQGSRDQLSYQLGLALGRFDDHGIAEKAAENALPHGILFLNGTGGPDSTDNSAAAGIREKADYLRTKFFAEDHLKRYENRPIYLPLSSEKKTFVAWCSIHRWTNNTLLEVLGLLTAEQNRLSAELADAAEVRNSGDRKAQVAAHKRHEDLLGWLGELQTFIRQVQDIAERGAPCVGCQPREIDSRFVMDLDDGVMINSAALWPLLLPQGWTKPKIWWGELCNATGKKDYDWSHLAARHFPKRVDQKCQLDPSLAVAHGVFWKYHPEKAYLWELRLQSPEELGPEFRLDETGSDAYRADFEAHHPGTVQELREAEQRRRERKSGQVESEQGELEFDDEDEEDE